MTGKGFKRKLADILSADVIGYRRFMGDDEEPTVRNPAAHRVLKADHPENRRMAYRIGINLGEVIEEAGRK